MQLNTNPIEENNQNATHENVIFGVVALSLIMINAFAMHSFIMSLGQDSNRIDKLWEPIAETVFFAVPVFVIVSLIVIWIITPKATPMKKIFKITSIIGFILFLIYSLFIGYIIALGSGMRN